MYISEARLKVGDVVRVSDPVSAKQPYAVSVEGTIIAISDKAITIQEGKSTWHLTRNYYNFELVTETSKCKHESGRTPINGFVICKHCGTNLKKVG